MRPALTIRASIAAAGTIVLAVGCGGGAPSTAPAAAGSAAGSSAPGAVTYRLTPTPTAGVRPGIHPSVLFGDIRNPYVGNATAAQTGRTLFVAYNCSGCHGGRGGGGMGPSLRDAYWTYGDSDAQLFGTIVEGRSAGMPAWGGRIPTEQIWQLITYIRTLDTPREPDPPPAQANPPMPKCARRACR